MYLIFYCKKFLMQHIKYFSQTFLYMNSIFLFL